MAKTPYAGFKADLVFDSTSFELSDNCGGLSLDDAVNHAFHFGRRKGDDQIRGGIGLYGIGLKRAVFKMGKRIEVKSTHASDSFVVAIHVDRWLHEPGWDFDLEPMDPAPINGTTVVVQQLHEEIAKAFSDTVFATRLYHTIARDYSFLMEKGFEVSLNARKVVPHSFSVVLGEEFVPVRQVYELDGVHIDITAGMAAPPPDDIGPPDGAPREADYFGWFVVCNDRVVLAGDKTDRTIWGRDSFPAWHPQYNGFIGIVRFHADDPALLPWGTTKREIDDESVVYRDALAQMRAATRPFLSYTNARRDNLEQAKRAEATAFANPVRPVSDIDPSSIASYPRLSKPASDTVAVQYSVVKSVLKKAAEALGNRNFPATKVGRLTFEYFVKREVPDEGMES